MTQPDVIRDILRDSNYSLILFTNEEIDALRQRITSKEVKGKTRYYVTCLVRNRDIMIKAKEVVRQLYLARLMDEYGYERRRMAVERTVRIGRANKRADIVIFAEKHVTDPYIIIKVKALKLKDGREQLESYLTATGAQMGVWVDGEQIAHFQRLAPNYIDPIDDIPTASQTLSQLLAQPFTLKKRIMEDQLANDRPSLKQSILENAGAAGGIREQLWKTANSSSSFTASISGIIDSLNLADHSAAYKAMNSASLSIAELFNANDIIADAFKATPSIVESWQEPLDSAYKSIIEATGLTSALSTYKDAIDKTDLLQLEVNDIRPAKLYVEAIDLRSRELKRLATGVDNLKLYEDSKLECLAAEFDDFQQYEAEKFERLAAEYNDLQQHEAENFERLAAEYNDLQQHEAENFERLAAEYDDFQQYEAEKFERLAAEYDDLYEDSQFARLAAEQLAIDSHLAEMSELSLLTQSSLAQLEFGQMGNALQLTTSMQDILQDNVLDLAQTYSNLIRSFEEQPSIISSLPTFVSKSPTVALFNETNLLESITTQERENFSLIKQKQHTREEIQSENSSQLPKLLAELDNDLILLWDGARYSLNSNNPDHARHTITSLRELVTHVLHSLAPDIEVKKWTTDPDYYHNSRPTRRARLMYISRGINHGGFTDFIKKDVDSVIATFALFQKGTHKINVEYTTEQLHAILVRVESTLRYLLEIGKISD